MNIQPDQLYIEDYNYSLSSDKIALFPLPQRDASKLLVWENGKVADREFKQLAGLLPPKSTLFLNNTRVIEARLFFSKPTGGQIEIFCLEPENIKDPQLAMVQQRTAVWQCLIGGASKWKPGQVLEKKLTINGSEVILQATYISKKEDAFIIAFSWNSDHFMAEVLHEAGAIPLPPYIKRKAEETDAERYQTIFAEQKGSVAAPTAALHFTDEVFQELSAKGIKKQYITLHVGAGTFKPVKTDTIAAHQMHSETFSVTLEALETIQKADPIIAVGTTTLRTLESLHWLGVKLITNPQLTDFTLEQWEPYQLNNHYSYTESITALVNYLNKQKEDRILCKTSLIIVPGYQFRSSKALITNFHQPKSTLLLLVAAFVGQDWKKIYEHALYNNYRFLSYGDSSLLWRKD